MTPSPLEDVRVLVVARATSQHPNAGGMEASAAALVQALQSLGARTALLTTAGALTPLTAADLGHDTVWEIPTSKPGRYSAAWWRRATWAGPWAEWGPTFVLGIGDAGAGFTRRSKTAVPVLSHAHGTTLMETRSALTTRSITSYGRAVLNLLRTPHRLRHLRRVDGVLAAGPAVRTALLAKPYRLLASKVVVVPNSIDGVHFAYSEADRIRIRGDLGLAADEVVYLAAGRLASDKGFDLAIRTVAGSSHHLIVLGDGPEGVQLQRLTTRLGADAQVHFVGRTRPKEVPAYLSAADQLIFPTRRAEGLPMILLEAAANGLPVLTSERAQVPEILMHSIKIANTNVAAMRAALRDQPRQGGAYLPQDFLRSSLPERLMAALRSLKVVT